MRTRALMTMILIGLALTLPFTAMADKYALLIGIDAYPGGYGLRGCARDVEIMKNLLVNKFNFLPRNIIVLLDGQATRIGIESAFRANILNQAGPGDTVVIYFSGHGSKVPDHDGDEPDGLDETLCPVDISQQSDTWLTDDEVGQWFSQLRADQVTLILDTCLSTGSGATNLTAKSLDLGFGESPLKGFEHHFLDPVGNHTLITGCAPGQNSYMMPDAKGSFFTAALTVVLTEMVREFTYECIAEPLTQYLHDSLSQFLHDQALLPTPQMEGNLHRALFGRSGSPTRTPGARTPAERIRTDDMTVRIRTDKSIYYAGEHISVTVEANRDCYIKLYNIQADNQIYLVFPNEWNQNNFVRAGITVIPGQRDKFEFVVAAPFGTERLIIAVSPQQFDDLYAINWKGQGFPRKLRVEARTESQTEVSYEVRPR